MADSNQSGGLGSFLKQLNEIAREFGEALNQAGEVKRNPSPTTRSAPRPASDVAPPEAPARQARPVVPERAVRQSDQAASGQMALQGGDVRRSLGQTPEEREEQLRKQRIAHAREEQVRLQKKAAHEKLQAQHRLEQQKIEAARQRKKPGAVAGAAAMRYAKFLKGSQRNVRDAVMLAEIIGPCRAAKGWPKF